MVNKKDTSNLGNQTWTLVQDVANSEVKSLSKMFDIFRNFLKMFDNNSLNISNYFDEKANDKSLKSMFYGIDGKRKTLIAKDFGVFLNRVLIPALNQNLKDFQKDFYYEYKALESISPVVMFGISERKFIDLDKNFTKPTNPKIPVEMELTANFWKSNHLEENEQVFRHNLEKRFVIESNKGKSFYATFRGENGIYEIARSYFMPKQVQSDNKGNVENSSLSKALVKINDKTNGTLGTTTALTQITPDATKEVKARLVNELDQSKETILTLIDLIANSDNPKSQATLLEIYQHILGTLQSKNFHKNMPQMKNKNVRFNSIMVKNKPLEINEGTDLIKYVSNI